MRRMSCVKNLCKIDPAFRNNKWNKIMGGGLMPDTPVVLVPVRSVGTKHTQKKGKRKIKGGGKKVKVVGSGRKLRSRKRSVKRAAATKNRSCKRKGKGRKRKSQK